MDLKECKLIDNQDRECGVYAIYNTENNKIYVGSSVDVYNRVYLEHIKLLNSNKHYNKYLQDAYNKDKESFIFVLIENIIDKNKLIEREQYWMDSFISYDRENGYNLAPTAGSMLGFKHSDKTKNKISKVQIGKKLSEQTKKKISESNKGEKSYWYGKKFTNQHIQKVIQKRKENGTLKHTKEAKEKISNALRKRVRKKESYEKVSEKLSVPVCQYDKYGNFLNEWVSITEASKSLGIHRGNISLVLKGKRKSSGGFIWKYKSEVEVENDNQSYPKTS